MKNLIIVESPSKAKTFENYLGADFKVMSSNGHIRDLKPHSFSIDTQTMMPEYEVPEEKLSLVNSLRDAARKADKVWLASDEDREGEAISWHLAEVLDLDVNTTNRMVFHEITKKAILEALDHPRHINQDLVNAQQARRVLDRIVGFELSPVLWRKIKPGLSAGRVQSVVVRLVVEREREIERYESKPTFVVSATFHPDTDPKATVKAELNRRFDNKADAIAFLRKCMGATFRIENLEKKPVKRSPSAPFMTSTLQQEAARRLGFSVSQTMRVAQSLYEKGYITYMRTDSLNLSDYCLSAAKQAITSQLGDKYSKTRNFQTRAKGAQEAHEAIRPTQMEQGEINESSQEKRLYRLIYLRTLASQMADARFEKTTVTIGISDSEEKFLATGEVMTFDGFIRLYQDTPDDENESATPLLPNLKVDSLMTPQGIAATERFGQRPMRYSEGSLIHKMEEVGIGRPSTYATFISTIQQRGYVEKNSREGVKRNYTCIELADNQIKETYKEEITGAEKNKLFPTDMGKIVNDYLIEWFPDILDLEFTARMEKDFDAVAQGKKDWNKLARQFYKNFTPLVTKAADKQTELRIGERQLGIDPKTGRMLSVKIGRYGPVAQLGLASDPEKPQFAQLRDGQSLDTITMEEALELFKLPRVIGQHEGHNVIANVSRFGPYISCNKQNVSIPKDIDVMEITLEQALELMAQKAEAEKKRTIRSFYGGIDIMNGRFGPYISYNGKNYRLPKDLATNIDDITVEQCQEVISKAPETTTRRRRKS